MRVSSILSRAHYCRNLEIKWMLTVLPSLLPNPQRIVWPEKTHQWGKLLIFFSPYVLSARVVCFFLPIAPALFTGSGINRNTSSLACFQLCKNTSCSLLSTLAHHNYIISPALQIIWVHMIDKCDCARRWLYGATWNAAAPKWMLNMYICWALFWAVMKNIKYLLNIDLCSCRL